MKDFKVKAQITLDLETFGETQEDAEQKIKEEVADCLWPKRWNYDIFSIEEVKDDSPTSDKLA